MTGLSHLKRSGDGEVFGHVWVVLGLLDAFVAEPVQLLPLQLLDASLTQPDTVSVEPQPTVVTLDHKGGGHLVVPAHTGNVHSHLQVLVLPH